MVKKIVAIFSLGLMMLMYSGCGNKEAPIEVEVFEKYNPLLYTNVKYLRITSLVDSVKITKIIPNRGKCTVGGVLDKGQTDFDKTLSYGETWDYIPLKGCNKLLSVDIATNQGEWSFSFQ